MAKMMLLMYDMFCYLLPTKKADENQAGSIVKKGYFQGWQRRMGRYFAYTSNAYKYLAFIDVIKQMRQLNALCVIECSYTICFAN